MYKDEIFEQALKDSKEQNLKELKSEIKSMESVIERFLSQILECTSIMSERDFNVCGV